MAQLTFRRWNLDESKQLISNLRLRKTIRVHDIAYMYVHSMDIHDYIKINSEEEIKLLGRPLQSHWREIVDILNAVMAIWIVFFESIRKHVR